MQNNNFLLLGALLLFSISWYSCKKNSPTPAPTTPPSIQHKWTNDSTKLNIYLSGVFFIDTVEVSALGSFVNYYSSDKYVNYNASTGSYDTSSYKLINNNTQLVYTTDNDTFDISLLSESQLVLKATKNITDSIGINYKTEEIQYLHR